MTAKDAFLITISDFGQVSTAIQISFSKEYTSLGTGVLPNTMSMGYNNLIYKNGYYHFAGFAIGFVTTVQEYQGTQADTFLMKYLPSKNNTFKCISEGKVANPSIATTVRQITT